MKNVASNKFGFKYRGRKVTVTHNAPGKKGKTEQREFGSFAEALAYIDRNVDSRLGTLEERNAWQNKGGAR